MTRYVVLQRGRGARATRRLYVQTADGETRLHIFWPNRGAAAETTISGPPVGVRGPCSPLTDFLATMPEERPTAEALDGAWRRFLARWAARAAFTTNGGAWVPAVRAWKSLRVPGLSAEGGMERIGWLLGGVASGGSFAEDVGADIRARTTARSGRHRPASMQTFAGRALDEERLAIQAAAWATLCPQPEAWPAWLRESVTTKANMQQPAYRLATAGVPLSARVHLAMAVSQPAVGFIEDERRVGRRVRAAVRQAFRVEGEGAVDDALRALAASVDEKNVAVSTAYVTDDILAVCWLDWWWSAQVGARLYRCGQCGTVFLRTGRASNTCGACRAPAARKRHQRAAHQPNEKERAANAKASRLSYFRRIHGREPTPEERRVMLTKKVAQRPAARGKRPMRRRRPQEGGHHQT